MLRLQNLSSNPLKPLKLTPGTLKPRIIVFFCVCEGDVSPELAAEARPPVARDIAETCGVRFRVSGLWLQGLGCIKKREKGFSEP